MPTRKGKSIAPLCIAKPFVPVPLESPQCDVEMGTLCHNSSSGRSRKKSSRNQKQQAGEHGVSMEEEHQRILRESLSRGLEKWAARNRRYQRTEAHRMRTFHFWVRVFLVIPVFAACCFGRAQGQDAFRVKATHPRLLIEDVSEISRRCRGPLTADYQIVKARADAAVARGGISNSSRTDGRSPRIS